MSDTQTHQVNLLDLVAFLLRWRRFLVTVVLIVALLVAIMSFLLPPKYRSTAVVRAQEYGGGGLGEIFSGKLSALSGISNIGLGFGNAPGNVFISILKSRWMCERVIEAMRLREVYMMPSAPIEDVILVLQQRTRFELNSESGALVIYADDYDPKKAMEIVQCFVDQLDARNQELKSTNARREREFVGQRLTTERAKLTALEDSLSRFQLVSGVLNPGEQVKATIQAAAAIEAQKLATQTEIEMNNQLRGPSNLENTFLRMRLASLDSSIRSLIRPGVGPKGGDVLLHLDDSPTENLTYLRLMRDIEIQQMLVGFLVQQFEQASIEEERNTPTIMRLDPPSLATTRVWPRRGMMVVFSSLGAFAFAVVLALLIEFTRRAARDPSHPQHQRVLMISRSWSRRKDD